MFWKVLGVVALAIWFGGGVIAGLVAPPAAFKFLAANRQLAGSIAGYVLGRFQVICMISGVAYGVSWILARRSGARPHRWALASVIVALLLVTYAHFGLDPQIAALRETMRTAGGAPDLAGAFGALHRRSVIIFGVEWLLVAAALVLHTISLARR